MVTGTLKKLKSELKSPVEYVLSVGDEKIPLNPQLGKRISLKFTGNIVCVNCGNPTKKSFSQGFCYPCMKKLAQCDMCILKPETCHYHLGTCREPEWGEAHCFIPHFVYLSNTSGLKVGITRHSQVPTRWIDQGATQALKIFRVATRQQSGFVETTFKQLIADKTNWRAMLKGDAEPLDLKSEAVRLSERLKEQLEQLITDQGVNEIAFIDDEVTEISYPVLEYPKKITSHNFDKNPLVEGILLGIKGQYLLFDTGVINIRKFTAYEVSFSGS
jgi:hypothetical protein